MDLDRDNNSLESNSRVYNNERGGSNFLAYLIGGLVIAVGLLAFLFYDGNNSGDVSTTGSTNSRVESPATPGAGSGMGGTTGTTTAPAAPATPSRPAVPAQ